MINNIGKLIKSLNSHISKADVLIISDYAKGVCSKSMTRKIIEIANSHTVPVLVDPKTSDLSCYQGSYLITPNFKEFKNMINNQDIKDWFYAALSERLYGESAEKLYQDTSQAKRDQFVQFLDSPGRVIFEFNIEKKVGFDGDKIGA